MPATFALSATLKVVPFWSDSRTATDIADTVTALHTLAIGDGTTAGNANAYWKDQLSIAAGASVTIDLRALPHKMFGGTATLSFGAVKVLMISNNSTTGSIVVGGSPSNRWQALATGDVVIGQGGVFYSANPSAGWATTATTKAITITNSGSAVALVDVYVAGVKS
jgi:hypothetical protein